MKKCNLLVQIKEESWTKGEESGHVQTLISVQLDCDGDALLLKVKQSGGIACHTRRNSCFYNELDKSGWKTIEPVLKIPRKSIKMDNTISTLDKIISERKRRQSVHILRRSIA